MTNERGMWDSLGPVLRAANLHPVRIENRAWPGTPDVWYNVGALELKDVDRWPPRGGALQIDHWTIEQRTWHRLRRSAGGLTTVCIRIRAEREWLFMDGLDAVTHLCRGTGTREGLSSLALLLTRRLPTREEVTKCLTRQP